MTDKFWELAELPVLLVAKLVHIAEIVPTELLTAPNLNLAAQVELNLVAMYEVKVPVPKQAHSPPTDQRK